MLRRLRAIALYGVVTVVLLWPLLRVFGSGYAHDAGDSILNTWILWWGTRAVPLSHAWWSGPMFFPAADSIALSELLLSLLPLSALVQLFTHNPVAAFNAVYVLSFTASGLAAYALTRELTGREDAALIGGLAFLLAPYRATQLSHVQVLSYYWAPLVLLGLHRYLTTLRRRWLVLFGAAWLLQVLANGYALFEVPVLVGLWAAWFVRERRVFAALAGALLMASLPLLPILLKYREVHDRLHLLRDINEVKRFGLDLADFAAAPPDLLVWGGHLGTVRPETAAFPGLTVLLLGFVAVALLWRNRVAPVEAYSTRVTWQRVCLALAVVVAAVGASAVVFGGWRIGPLRVEEFRKPFSIALALSGASFLGGTWFRRAWCERSVASFYLVAAVGMNVLALGPEPRAFGDPFLYEPPYAWLMRLPGFDVMRVPARFLMLAGLCQAVLIAFAIARWATGARRPLVVALVALGVVADGWIRLPVAAAPTAGILAWPDVAAVVELPLAEINADFAALTRSMVHGVPTVNGVSGYYPPHILPLARALQDRQYAALYELSPERPVGVALDRAQAGAEATAEAFGTLGLTAGPSAGQWNGFIVPPRVSPRVLLGERLAVSAATASRHGEYTGRMLDQDLFTAWGTEAAQADGDEVRVDLGVQQDIGAVVLEMGAYSFGYPQSLEIAISPDQERWLQVPSGDIGVLTVRAAVQAPETVPVTLAFANARGRFIRLRQTGVSVAMPWWIAELRVYAPPASPR